jgi:hypothetical protein
VLPRFREPAAQELGHLVRLPVHETADLIGAPSPSVRLVSLPVSS